MLKDWEYWTLTALAAGALALAILNVSLFQSNRTLQTDLALKQQFVQQSAKLQGLNNEIIRALAELSHRNQDAQVRALLSDNGVTFQAGQPGQPAPSGPGVQGDPSGPAASPAAPQSGVQ